MIRAQTCVDFTCSDQSTLNQAVICPDDNCTSEVCCVSEPQELTCSGFSCEGQPMQNNPSAQCGDNPCTVADCCTVSRTPPEGVTTCLNFDCSGRPGFESNQTVECSSDSCTVDECCTIETETFTCFGFECPSDMVTNSSQNCSTNPCTIDECCTQQQTEEVLSIAETNVNGETTERQNNGDGTTTVTTTNQQGERYVCPI